jgi:hypothetical protein
MQVNVGPPSTVIASDLQMSDYRKACELFQIGVTCARSGISANLALRLVSAIVAAGLIPLVSQEPSEVVAAQATDDLGVFAVPAPRSSPAYVKALRAMPKSTTVDFHELPLNDALRFLSEYHNIALRRDDEALRAGRFSPDRRVTLRLKGVALRSVLRLILEPAKLGVILDEGGLVITTRERAAAHLSEFNYPLRGVVGAGIPLADLGEAITQTIDPTSWQKKGGRGLLRVEDATLYVRQRIDVHEQLEDFLRELFSALSDPRAVADDDRLQTSEYRIEYIKGLGVSDNEVLESLRNSLLVGKSPENGDKEVAKIERHRLILTQPAWMLSAADELFIQVAEMYEHGTLRISGLPEAFAHAAGLLPFEVKRRIARKRLAHPITANFPELSLTDALVALKVCSNSKIWVDEESRAEPSIRDVQVRLNSVNESLSSALDRLLDPLELDWDLFDADVIVITTRRSVSERMEPRVYRTRELLTAGQTEKGLMERIGATEPDSWAARGGTGQMHPLPGVIVVTQNRRVHEQIARLLVEVAAGKEK